MRRSRLPVRSGLTAMSRNDPFAPVKASARSIRKTDPEDWEIVAPVPSGAKSPPNRHRELGKPTKIWTYNDRDGRLLGYVARFVGPDGKQCRPLTFWRQESTTETA